MGIKVTSHPSAIPQGADMIVEATGSPEGLSTAIQLIRPRGTLVLKSTYHGDVSLNMATFVIQEISLIGSRCGPFPPAIRLLASKHIRVDPLIHARYPLLDGVLAMEKAAQPGVRKVLLQMT
ncbi:MAG: zinc-binding dehydrogenase, partial [Nitrospira sp.]|nr:zinc-binding dehydrogenase [Nitrospira sp.]